MGLTDIHALVFEESLSTEMSQKSERAPVVLVVDDDPDIWDALAEILEAEGDEIRRARNGKEALERLEPSPPDLILLDLMMPVMDGWTFRQEQRRSGNTVPVVLLSAAGELDRHRDALGAVATIAKPFDLDRVISAIEGVCDRRATPRPARA